MADMRHRTTGDNLAEARNGAMARAMRAGSEAITIMRAARSDQEYLDAAARLGDAFEEVREELANAYPHLAVAYGAERRPEPAPLPGWDGKACPDCGSHDRQTRLATFGGGCANAWHGE